MASGQRIPCLFTVQMYFLSVVHVCFLLYTCVLCIRMWNLGGRLLMLHSSTEKRSRTESARRRKNRTFRVSRKARKANKAYFCIQRSMNKGDENKWNKHSEITRNANTDYAVMLVNIFTYYEALYKNGRCNEIFATPLRTCIGRKLTGRNEDIVTWTEEEKTRPLRYEEKIIRDVEETSTTPPRVTMCIV